MELMTFSKRTRIQC